MQSIGVKSVDLSRGPGGFGFTLSSQGPCVLSCILASSPAHKAGLRPGDQIICVNGSSVEKSPHEQVVKLIARSPNGVVNLGIRHRADKSNHLTATDSQENQEPPDEETVNANILNRVDKVVDELKAGNLLVNTPSSFRLANVNEHIINEDEIVSDEELRASFSETLRSESSTDSVFLEQSYSKGRRASEGDYMPAPANQKLNRLLYPALTPARTTSTINHFESTNILPDLTAIVGYLGSIELPASSSLQTASLNAIRSCVRRLRAQQKVHVIFALEVSTIGIRLIDKERKSIVTYPIRSLAFTGVCSDDKRVFGIVTRKSSEGNRPNSWHDKTDVPNNVNCSCHVFTVDPEIVLHRDHASIADHFHLQCTPSINDNGECKQFLSTSKSILQAVNGLFKERTDSQSTDEIGAWTQSVSSSQSDSDAVKDTERHPVDMSDTQSEHLDNHVQSPEGRIHESVVNECVMETPNHRICVRVTDGDGSDFEENHIISPENKPFRHRAMQIERVSPVSQKKHKHRHPPEEYGADKKHKILTNEQLGNDIHISNLQDGDHKSDNQQGNVSDPMTESSPDSHGSINSKEKTRRPDVVARSSLGNSQFFVNHNQRLTHSAENLAHSEYVSTSQSNLDVSPSICSSTQSIHSLGSMPGDTSGIDGCVARWALGFDKLMEDAVGLKCFQEFLKKEFSEENIVFWVACEDFRSIADEKELKSAAVSIFDTHLSSQALMPVNIDSSAIRLAEEHLVTPSNDMYRLQQQQVYTLMKFDSYPRFLKSDLYRQCLVSDMEGLALPFDDEKPDKGKLTKKGICLYLSSEESECSSISSRGSYTFQVKRPTRNWGRRRSSKKSTSSYDESKTPNEKKKSFLPWKGKQSNKKGISRPFDSQPSSTRSSLSSLSDSFPSCSTESLEAGRRESEFQFCRIVLPDHSSTIITAKAGQTVRQALTQLCERRHMAFVATDVFLSGAQKAAQPKELDADMSGMAGKEMTIEHRSLFRIELPTGIFVVKTRPDQSIRRCLEPILKRHGLDYPNVTMHLVNCEVPLDSGIPVASIEHQCVVVETNDQFTGNNNGPPKINVKPPMGFSSPRRSSRRGSSWDDSTFDDIIRGKKQSLGNGYFDDAGVWVPGLKPFRSQECLNDDSFGRSFLRGPGLFSRKRKESEKSDKEKTASFKTGRPTAKSNSEVTELLDLLSRAQGKRMDDQRGELGKDSFELPAFLRLPEEHSSTAPPPPPPPPPFVTSPNYHTGSLKIKREARPVVRKTLSTPVNAPGQTNLMNELADKLQRRSMSETAGIPEGQEMVEPCPGKDESYSPWELRHSDHHRRINMVRPRASTDGAVFTVEAVTPVRLDGSNPLSHARQQRLHVSALSESMPDTLPTRTRSTQPITVNTIRGLHISTGNIKHQVDESYDHDGKNTQANRAIPMQKYHTYSHKQRTCSSSSAPDYSRNVPYVYEASPTNDRVSPRTSKVRHINSTDSDSKATGSPFHFPQANAAKKADVYVPSSPCPKPYRVSNVTDAKLRPRPIIDSADLIAELEGDRTLLADTPSSERVTATPAAEPLKTSPVQRILSPVLSDRDVSSPLPLPPSPLPDHVDEWDFANFPPPTPICSVHSSTQSNLNAGGGEGVVTPSPDLSVNKTITPSTNDRTFMAEPTNEGTPFGVPKESIPRRSNVSKRLSSRLHDDSLKSGKELPKLDPYVTYESEDLRITFV